MQTPRFFRFLLRSVAVAALCTVLFSCAPVLRAEQNTTAAGTFAAQDQHLVSPGQLQQQLNSAATERQKNIDNLTQFLSTPTALKAMKSANVTPTQIKKAIPTLSDAELANLSARATKAQADFSAGILGIGTLLLIIVVILLVIVIAAIH